MTDSSTLLIDESPLMVLPTLAQLVGLNEAIVLQQIHFWLRIKQKDQKTYRNSFREGKWWVYNSAADWQEQFPWWGDNTIRRALSDLIKRELLTARQLATDKWDKTLWYTIDYDKLNALLRSAPPKKGSSKKRVPRSTQVGQIEDTNPGTSIAQVGQMDLPRPGGSISPDRADHDLPNLGESLTESPENSSEISQRMGKVSTSSFSRKQKWTDLPEPEREPWRNAARADFKGSFLHDLQRMKPDSQVKAIDGRAKSLYEQAQKGQGGA